MEEQIKEQMRELRKRVQFLEDYENKKKKMFNITLTYEELQTLRLGSYSDVKNVIDNILDQYQKQAKERQQH